MKIRSDESGQALVFTALCMALLLGFVAFAADVGTLLRAKRLMQTAADSGAIAGALGLNYGEETTAAQAAATQNGVTNGTGGGVVTVNSPPSYGPHAGAAGYVELIVSQSQPTFFMNVFNWNSMTVTARAVATLGNGTGCIYTLGSSGTDIGITGNASVSAPNCGIIDDSTSNDAMRLTGNITLDANSIGVVGGYSETGNVSVTPTPIKGIAPAGDPLAFLTPPAVPKNCSTSIRLVGNKTRTISPGCYGGISVVGNSALTLNPGTYVINGPLSITGNSAITGTGVTLDLLGSTSLTGNVALNLSAPTSGTYDGILIYQPSSNTGSLSLVGNSGSTLEGIVYAADAPVSLTGNSGSKIYTDFVVQSLTLVGNASFQDYALMNGSSPLTAARLVE